MATFSSKGSEMITKFLVRKSQTDYMFRRALIAVCLCASGAVMAAPIDKELKFNEGYVSSVTKAANDAGANGAKLVRESLRGQPTAIPTSWRLVSVIPKAGGYVMFFQDSDASVHSIGIDGGGAVTGSDVLLLRSYR
jgi:hypothetical protein